MRITTVKELRRTDTTYSMYKLSSTFTVYGSSKDGTAKIQDSWTKDDVFYYHKRENVLIALSDKSKINPSILFKAKISLLTPEDWA